MASPKIRRKSPKTAFYVFNDEDSYWRNQPVKLGIIRCPDGDLAEYERLLKSLLNDIGVEENDYQLAPPVWEWLRMNACRNDDYAWTLGHPSGAGPGNFRGVIVQEAPKPPVADVGRPVQRSEAAK